ncbi:prosalusin [Lampris incognitus]|uniref:prosalusin n=1 Tax=Lampris incognitus TaxID=2546036 RepID=UPI0024B5F9B6|nr:prosalusin [Lampris incognitus]
MHHGTCSCSCSFAPPFPYYFLKLKKKKKNPTSLTGKSTPDIFGSGSTMAVLAVLLLLSVLNPVLSVFQKLYCSLADSCDCDFKPCIRDLEWDLYKNLYGQHLAQDIVSEAVTSFLKKENPDRPLVLSFHGSSGTGKTLVSSMLGSHLYSEGMGSQYVHLFLPSIHFPLPDHVKEYQWALKSWVEGKLKECAHSIFIFDEMERMPLGVIDILKPFLGPSHVVFRTNYRKAIYVFISTTGEAVINQLALKQQQAGLGREEIRLEDLKEALVQSVYNSSTSGFYHSDILQEELITRYVPFLPLTRRHVERCARWQLCQLGMCHRTDVVEAVGGDMVYTPDEGQYFSTIGCKAVSTKITLFL